MISFLSGPVKISPKVSKALAKPAISHRQPEFSQLLKEVQNKLKLITKAKYSALMMGSGSLANEAIAANLSTLKDQVGLIISNGEFGERLINHASCYDLNFKTIKQKWGEEFNYKKIEEVLRKNKIDWIWLVHCETSTGMMNDLEEISRIAKKTNTKICVDCISSIGIYPIDLSKIYLASASSNKGLESFAGLAIVFYNHHLKPSLKPLVKIPKYLDIEFYLAKSGVPFTFSSNLVEALNVSLDTILQTNKTAKIKKLNNNLLDFLRREKIKIVVDGKSKSHAITTVELANPNQSKKLGIFLESNGILIHYQNSYLQDKNWLQIAFFSSSIKSSELNKLKDLMLKFRDLDCGS